VNKLQLDGHFEVQCHGADGKLKWAEDIGNLVVNTGLDNALDVTLAAGTPITSWFVGLTDGTPTVAATDTSASHAGWTEITAYVEATREALTLGAVASQSVDNSASPAEFNINGTATVGGCFIISVSTKGGATGTLFSVGAFAGGDRAVVNLDVLTVTYTLAASDV
jgi:hypothetical protein